MAEHDDPPPPPRVVSSSVVYENQWLRVREDRLERADGSPGLYSVIEKAPAAIMIPLDGDDHVFLVEQYRHPIGRRVWELPQGAWDDEHSPDPEELARGELAEETGLRAASMERLGSLFFAYGISNQSVDVWLATGLEQGEASPEPEEEGLRSARFPLAEVELMLGNEIGDAATVAAFGLLRRHRS
jgi:8-oxo-dGTP pyrophosphatase MutT (NUDIX family)